MEYYSAISKNKIMPFAGTWMEPETPILSEVSQKKKDKYHLLSLICRIQNMTQMSLSVKQKQTHRHRGQTRVAKVEGVGQGGMKWEFGTRRGKLVYTEWI